MTQMPGGDLVVTHYYNLNNNGFGDLIRYPLDPAGPDFDSPQATFSDGLDGKAPFQRIGQVRLTPFTTPDDFPAPCPGWEDNAYGASGIEGPAPCAGASKEPLDFEETAAARPDYAVPDLARRTPLLTLGAGNQPGVRTVASHQVTVEWFRDVEPILEARCASCHGGASPAAGLPLARAAPRLVRDGVSWPAAYYRLVLDASAEFSAPPPNGESR